ncbi:methyltransferase, TIGR04325 family [Ferrovibrio xuzhouensis]|uniref:Methyltransferase, TIGR04325 family n=1 Tax=Ferrovibrio xuzhouensis TaxID=1576914 RepID=A0ABV7VMJ1_9PROT
MKSVTLKLGVWRMALEAGRAEGPVSSRGNRFETGFGDWNAAAAAAVGYDATAILDRAVAAARDVRDGRAMFERDTLTFHRREFDHALLAWMLYAGSRGQPLRVLDFGGALGSLYYQHRRWLEHLSGFAWGVVEQAHFVAAGRREFETPALHFFATAEDCVSQLSPDFLLLSSVLQYLPRPHEILGRLLAGQFPFVLIHRTMAQRHGPDEIAVQHVDPAIYPASYPLWLLDAVQLEAIFAEYGYEIVDNFDPYPGSYFGPPGHEAPYQSWFLEKKR